MSGRDLTDVSSCWDDGMVRTVKDALSHHVHFWADRIKECDLPGEHPEALEACREMRTALAVLRDLS